MQKPFYHAFTIFTDTLQIDAYSNRFHLPPSTSRIPRNNPLQPHKSAAYVCRYFAITFFQQSPEMTIRRIRVMQHTSENHNEALRHDRRNIPSAAYLSPPPTRLDGAHTYSGCFGTYQFTRRRASGRKPIVFSSIFDHLFLVLRVTFACSSK
jgi:hypothetical protein